MTAIINLTRSSKATVLDNDKDEDEEDDVERTTSAIKNRIYFDNVVLFNDDECKYIDDVKDYLFDSRLTSTRLNITMNTSPCVAAAASTQNYQDQYSDSKIAERKKIQYSSKRSISSLQR
jgi:hypothetical protein